jgi:alginate O-acetyltransferase complex protein AlgI
MNLISLEIFAWFTCLVTIYWLLPKTLQLGFVSLFTALFLLVYSPLSLLTMVGVSCVVYYLQARNIALAIVLCIAGFVLYRLLTIDQAGSGLDSSQEPNSANAALVLLGFSYFILRVLHYLFERNRRTLPEHTFTQFIYYLFFLPTLFVGPINRFDSFLRDQRRRRWDSELFSLGLSRISYGLVKIVVLAYFLVNQKMQLWILQQDQSNLIWIQYLECWQYGLNLYFQFSGYCDIAIGLSLLMGFRIPENFNFPFLKRNISEFWRSWHMTLTSWSRDYIYPQVAAVTRMPYLAILFSMIFIGIWHELSLRYLVWGLYHGLGIMAHRAFQRSVGGQLVFDNVILRSLTWFVSVLITLHFVILGFVFTKENTIAESLTAVSKLLGV